jgi:pimeloyl-ACP methyl ester carboxylesterase
MPFATSDGARIYYEVHGTGPALVLVHGSGGHHAIWWQQVPYFARRFTVVLPDLRGFGKSDDVPEGPDAQDFPKDIRAVLDDAKIDRAVILGQSIGALCALKLAVETPARVAGVVLAHSLGGLDDPELKQLAGADRKEAEKLPVVDRLMSRDFQQRRPELSWLFREMGTFNQAKMQDLRNLSAGGPSVDAVNRAGVPILFLGGANDAVIRPATLRKAHEKLSRSSLTLIPEGPHSLYWECPDLFNCAVHQFLDTVYGGS